MNCPKCSHIEKDKDRIVRVWQRYQRKACHSRYIASRKSDIKPIIETKCLSLQLDLEGLKFRANGRILQIRYGTVYQWIKWGSQVSFSIIQEPAEIMENR